MSVICANTKVCIKFDFYSYLMCLDYYWNFSLEFFVINSCNDFLFVEMLAIKNDLRKISAIL